MTTSAIKIEQTIQAWGNGLAVRLPAPIARAVGLVSRTPVSLEVVEGGIFLRVRGQPKLSLAQKLEAFDPARHGGEAMATMTRPVGAKRI